MKENQERAEIERNRNLRYVGNTGNSTELNDFLSEDKGQGSKEMSNCRQTSNWNLEIPFRITEKSIFPATETASNFHQGDI